MTPLSEQLFRTYALQDRPARRQRQRTGPPVVPQTDDRPYAGIVLLILGGAMALVGTVATALLLIGLFGS